MKRNLYLWVIAFISVYEGLHAQNNLKLWYDQPAKVWEETLPLGNGRLGAMPDGGIVREKIVLNDITLWSGSPQDADDPEAVKHLPEIRKLLLDGKNDEAEELMYRTFVCQGAGSGHGNGANVPYGSYQVLGNLYLEYDLGTNTEHYRRELDIENAVATTSFREGGVNYKREYLTSFTDDVILIKLTASQPGNISFEMGLDRPERYETKTAGNELIMEGQLNNGTDGHGMKYIVKSEVLPVGGEMATTDTTIRIENANSVVILISAATDYKDPDFEKRTDVLMHQVEHQKFDAIKKKHSGFYHTLFDRAKIDLGKNLEVEKLPTNLRLERFAQTKDDPGIAELYFQYGRYLAISSTRPGLLPPNLQGLWANTIQTPWNGDYHLDINIQMNHWPLETTNLGMLNQPYFDLVKSLVEPGRKTALTYYNGKGWVAHVITNIWGYTSPGEHPSWGSTNSGSGWLAELLWRHFEFTLDTAYLADIYPVLKGSARFYSSTLVPYPEKSWLVTAPSNSPENAFILPNGHRAHTAMAPTMDNQIIRALFRNVIKASEILKVDPDLRQELKIKIQKLPPNQIAPDGRLMEWLKNYQEAEPHHRHVSHLWALYPGHGITLSGSPSLAEAVEKSLEGRGDQGTGWSLAWKINLWARLSNGERAFKLLTHLLKPVTATGFNMTDGGGTYPNLFCAHPPFQIDGNFGGTAGIAEMLLQSHEGFVNILPALPKVWYDGSFSGLRVRGGGEVNVIWKDGLVTKMVLRAVQANTFKIKVPKGVLYYTTSTLPGKNVIANQQLITVALNKGEQIRFFK